MNAQLRLLRRREPRSPRPGASDGGDGLAAPTGATAAPRASTPLWPAILVCLAIAALTLLLPSTPTYDPWAWVLWGREIAHFDLVTTGGPSWKPLPILFTTPFSLFGDDAGPLLWLWVARAGGLLACVMAYRMAHRLTGGGWYGVLAGVGAALALFASFRYVRDAALGNSEPLLAAIVLWAFERHLDGRRDHALYLGVVGALLRPEVWPFLGLYGLWLWFREPRLRARMIAFAALIPALWFLPEWWGSGDPLRAGARANAPNPGSVAFAERPAIELFEKFRLITILPVEVGSLIAVVVAAVAWVRRRAQGAILVLAAGGAAWFALVAIMTEAGFAGNLRYLIVSTAAACVLGGIGAARVLQGVGLLAQRVLASPRTANAITFAAFLIALAISAPIIEAKVNNIERVAGGLEHEAELWSGVQEVIDRAGGRERLLACGGIFSGPFQTQMIAFELHVHGIDIGWRETPPPGVAFRTRTVPDGPLVTKPTDSRFRLVDSHDKWRLLTVPPAGGGDCPAASPYSPTAPLPPRS